MHSVNLSQAVRMWQTPNASKAGNDTTLTKSGDGRVRPNKLGWAVSAQTQPMAGGQLNPDWTEWLMGWPVGWTSLEPLPEGAMEEWLRRMEDGSWWADEHGLPRVKQREKHDTNRLKAIGNGQVPHAAALAWDLLS